MKYFLLIGLILLSNFAFCQGKKVAIKDSIADRDTFDVSKPINSEISTYLNKPYDLLHVVPATGRVIFDCRKSVAKKSYWYGKKNLFMLSFSCKKDKSAFAVGNHKSMKETFPDDEVIEVYSSVHEPEFRLNDFIGQSSASLIKRFGDTYIKKNGYIIYHDHTDKLLVLYAPAGKVIFYRFVHMNKSIKMFSDIDKDILKIK